MYNVAFITLEKKNVASMLENHLSTMQLLVKLWLVDKIKQKKIEREEGQIQYEVEGNTASKNLVSIQKR